MAIPPVSAILAACLVVAIADGDSLTVLCDRNQQIKIRLAEIDAPEKKQPFGQHSRQSLAEMCFKKQAEFRPQTMDRYGRTVARIICEGKDANAEQVRRGMAWVYDKYVQDKSLYALQDEVRSRRVGLWSAANPIPPWEWRHSRKSPNRRND